MQALGAYSLLLFGVYSSSSLGLFLLLFGIDSSPSLGLIFLSVFGLVSSALFAIGLHSSDLPGEVARFPSFGWDAQI